jgi:hypothetical protein
MKNVSTERLTEIVDEVMHLMDAPDIFGFLDGTGNSWAVEARLQEIMQTRQQFETIELAMYLRTCNTCRNDIPTWQPLLNVAIEQGRMRSENVDDIFYGMMPRQADPQRNTGYPK